jgi:hypothetical protein
MPPPPEVNAMGSSESAAPTPRGRNMFIAVASTLTAIEGYYLFNAQVRDPLHLPLGLLMLFLAALPGLLWAKRGRATLPVFEVLMLTTANAYAFPLLNGHSELIFYTSEDITRAALAVILFQLTAIVVYQATRGRASTHLFWREEVISEGMGKWLMYGMVLNTVYSYLSTFTEIIPPALESILRAIFFGIGIVCTFITMRRLGEGRLSSGERVFLFTNLFLQCAIMMSTLFLVAAVSTLLLALVGYVSSSGRLPVFVSATILFSIAVLHNGKSEMRAKYWENEYESPGITELPAFFIEWFQDGLKVRPDQEGDAKMTSKLIERTSLFHIMCLVVSTTPSSQPYLEGETYWDIPAQFVPRIFWPGKPLGHVSTSKLAVYYGLQTDEETLTTTIGFGMLTEAFANFGWLGVAGIGAFLAVLIKKIQCWAEDSPLFSYGGLVLVILLAWSFQVEFTLSIWLASLYQAIVAVLIIPMVLRRFFGS